MWLRRVLLAFAVWAASAGLAFAQEDVVYLGPHPPHPAVGGPFCTIAEQHVHPYVPADPGEFLRTRGARVFLGDPALHGYQGATWSYPGPHPLPAWLGSGRCDRTGWHAHHFRAEGVAEPPAAPAPFVYPDVWWVPAPFHHHHVFPKHVHPRRHPPPPPHSFETRPPPPRVRPPDPRSPGTSSVPPRRSR